MPPKKGAAGPPAAGGLTPYEVQREERILENAKKLDELAVPKLATAIALEAAAPAPKKRKVLLLLVFFKKRKEVPPERSTSLQEKAAPAADDDASLRRSSRASAAEATRRIQDRSESAGVEEDPPSSKRRRCARSRRAMPLVTLAYLDERGLRDNVVPGLLLLPLFFFVSAVAAAAGEEDGDAGPEVSATAARVPTILSPRHLALPRPLQRQRETQLLRHVVASGFPQFLHSPLSALPLSPSGRRIAGPLHPEGRSEADGGLRGGS